jgi:alanine racemase
MGPTVAIINHNHIRHNLQMIRDAVGNRKIMAVVKANAYGHGEKEVAQTAIEFGCEYLGVAFLEEGIRLRQAGILKPILVFGAHLPEYLQDAIKNNLEITITSFEQMEALSYTLQGTHSSVKTHLKIDTGMNRVGFPIEKAESALQKILNISHFELKGVYSHFATSDEEDQTYALLQLQRFRNIIGILKKKIQHEVIFHIANSGAIMNIPSAYFDMVRPGIMLYGYPPSPHFKSFWQLKEAMSLHSRLGLIKFVKKNEPISYGRRFYTRKDTFIGVIPAGYADGISRMNTNLAQVCIKGVKYPLVGTVCMDMVMVDLGTHSTHKTGEEVVIYGDQISITQVADRLQTIPYEITCNISARVPRIHRFTNVEE